MANKLVERFNGIEVELDQVRQLLTQQIADEAMRERIVELETKQVDLKVTLQHLIALSKIRDEAWRTLSYGTTA